MSESVLERYVYKKTFELLLGESYDIVNKIIDYSVKSIVDNREKFLQAPILTGAMGILSEGYKDLIDEAIDFMKDNHGGMHVSKDALKLSLKMIDYLKKKLERELYSV